MTKSNLTTIFILLSAILLSSCKEDVKSILEDTQRELNCIQSASYQSGVKSWEPYQDEAERPLWPKETIEQRDSSEPYAGCKFISWSEGNIIMCYDGQRRMRSYSQDHTFEIDSLFKGITEYRVVGIPFYQSCLRMIDYALTTDDNTELTWDENDTVYIVDLIIHGETQVEFTMARLDPHLGKETLQFLVDPEEPTSHYQLLIDKQTKLPVRYNRYLSHNYSYEAIVGTPVFNKNLDTPINCYQFIPEGYVDIHQDKKNVQKSGNSGSIIGTKAIDFTLTDDEGIPMQLSSFRGKTVLLMFTGIGCGPCKLAIPFLNQLVNEQDSTKFQLISLECWKNDQKTLKAYKQNYGVNYPLLLNGADVQEKYCQNNSAPQFFVINPEGLITSHFEGWSDRIGEAIKKSL